MARTSDDSDDTEGRPTEPIAHPTTARRTSDAVRARSAFALLGLIIVSLLVLLGALLAFERQATPLYEEIETSGVPARRLTDGIRLSLAREIAGLIAYQGTGREDYRALYRRSAAEACSMLAALAGPAARLGPDAVLRLNALRDDVARWHASVEAARLLDDRVPPTVRLEQLASVYARFNAAAAAAASMASATGQAMAERRAAIQATARLWSAVTIVLGLLALAATLAVTWLALRLRAAGIELRHRAEDEAALLEAARTIGGTVQADEMFRRVVAGVARATHAGGAYLERTGVPGSADEVEVVAASGQGVPPPGTRAPYPGSLTEAGIARGKPERVSGPRVGGAGDAPPHDRRRDTRLIIPLLADDDAIGALVLVRPAGEPRFSPREVALAHGFGDLLSIALRRTALAESVERERRARIALLDAAGEGIFGIDLDGRCTFLNRAGAKMLGYSPAEAIGRNMHDLIHHTRADGTSFPADACPITRVMRDGVGVSVEDDVIWRKDGTSFRAEYSSNPIREGGRITGAVVAFKDITERKWAEESRVRLLEREREARGEAERRAQEEQALRRATGALSASFTEEQVIHRIAQSAVQATNADGAIVERIDIIHNELEVVSVAGDRVVPVGARIPYTRSYAERTIEGSQPEVISRLAEAELRLPNGLVRDCPECSALIVPLINAGEPIGALILTRGPDKLEFRPDEVGRAHTFGNLAALAFRRIHVLQESENRRIEFERVMESRSRLMRGFSHDVRNPLGAADGLLEVLESGIPEPLTAVQKEHVARARRSIRSALELIDNLLRLARAETGRIEIAWAAVDVRDAVRDVAEEYRAQAEAKGLDTTIDVPETLPLIVSDASRIRQALGNLLSNAVKYTERGGITVRIARKRRDGAPGPGEWIAIAVSDTGPGIPEEKRDMLFREFHRLEPGRKRGAGLGLAFSRRVAHALGGEITFESEVGVGSTFTLWLPLRQPAGARARPAAD